MHAFCFLCCKNSIQKMNECISFTVTWDLIGLQLRDSLKVIRHGECKCFAVYLRCVLLYFRFIAQSQLWPFFEQHTLFLVLVQVFLSLALVFLSLPCAGIFLTFFVWLYVVPFPPKISPKRSSFIPYGYATES